MSFSYKLIINAKSGHDEKDAAISLLTERINAAGRKIEVIRITKKEEFPSVSLSVVQAAKEDGSIVVAAGGDGSINLIAGLCHQHGVPIGVIPMGTFNFFARDIGISVEIEEAVDTLLNGKPTPVAVGMLNDQIFLVHAGIGLYPEIMRNREKHKNRFGRYRIVALFSSFVTLMSTRKTYHVTIQTETSAIEKDTLNIFVGNNALQLEKLGLTASGELKQDELAVILLSPGSVYERLRLAFWGSIGQMKMDSRIERFAARNFTVTPRSKSVKVAIDGELMTLKTPLHFKTFASGLNIILPEKT